MRRALRTLLIASVMILTAGAGAGAAQTDTNLDIKIEPDARPRALMAAGLSVVYTVTVTDKATGQPVDRYVVFAHATNRAGEKSIAFACGHTNDVDPRTPPGVYYCTVILDHGGEWTFVAVVSDKSGDADSPVPVAQASVPFELASNQVVTDEVPGSELSASAWDIGVLFSHTSVAIAWFLCVVLLVALSLPRARRLLSTIGLHRLERRFDLLVKATWVTTGLVLGSGTYLTLNQTAYATPFSSSSIEAVFKLPYARPYFLALAIKITLYVVMAAATFPLIRGAQRRMLVSNDTPPTPEGPLLDDALPARGGVVCDVRTESVRTELPAIVLAQPAPRHRAPAVAAGVIAVGGAGIALCVTILKYLHELIESARGLL
jgi:hypothetical protein